MVKILPIEIFYIYFSPYTAHAITIDGIVYPTVEHVYQCLRYTDKKIREEIRKAISPVKAWEISTTYKHLQVPEFKDAQYKVGIMKMLMLAKAQQHEEVRKAHINTGNMKIVKHIVTYPPGDGFWDDGVDGKGENHIGKMWMEIRGQLSINSD
jgi:ribA/ribD-fused uncharacterized protein